MRKAGMIVCMLATVHAAHADVVSTFNTGLDGWFGDVPAFQHTWGPSGGNTGGYADFLDQDSGTGRLNASGAFLGNWSALNGVRALRWDSIVFADSFASSSIPFEVIISGPGGQATFTTSTNQNVWHSWVTTTAVLDANLWTVNSGTWLALLADVTSLRVLVERVANSGTSAPTNPGDHCGMDNFTLVVPAPGSGALLGAGVFALGRRRRHSALRA